MKKIFAILLVVLAVPVIATASPFLVCDPQSGVEYYEITGLPAPLNGSHVAAQVDGSLRFDLANLPSVTVVQQRSIQVRACVAASDTVTGSCSAYVPFVFTQSAPLNGPSNIKLRP